MTGEGDVVFRAAEALFFATMAAVSEPVVGVLVAGIIPPFPTPPMLARSTPLFFK